MIKVLILFIDIGKVAIEFLPSMMRMTQFVP